MRIMTQMKIWFLLVVLAVVLTRMHAIRFGEARLVFDWTTLELDWPSGVDKEEAIRNGSYVPERNLLAGIKVYKDDVYLAIPRWIWTSGHPVTLAKLVKVQGQYKLSPYPNWAAQKQGDCQALQYVQSMEIDPNTGLMYVIDTGRTGNIIGVTHSNRRGTVRNLCPAKLVVYDLNSNQQVDRYEFPDDVVSRDNNFMNDIVLDYVDGKVRYVYISDANEGRIHVFDFRTRTAYNLEHPSMKVEGRNGSVIHINGKDYIFNIAVDGIAMSPDFSYVFYCPLSGYNLYQVPTSVLRDHNYSGPGGPRLLGRKISQTDGLAHGSKHLFYGVLSRNAVYYWDVDKDMVDQNVGIDKVKLATQVELVRNDTAITWPDTFAFDNQGWLWFVANSLNTFKDLRGQPLNRIWKVYVNETSYLYQADRRTARLCTD